MAGSWQLGEERTGKSVEFDGSESERLDDVMVKFMPKFEKSERKTRENLRLGIFSGPCFL
jgi:hypothetical protein